MRAAAGVLLGLVGGCTTPTVAARALWIGQVHDVDGSRTLHVYAGGEITERVLRPTAVDAGTDGQRLLVELVRLADPQRPGGDRRRRAAADQPEQHARGGSYGAPRSA